MCVAKTVISRNKLCNKLKSVPLTRWLGDLLNIITPFLYFGSWMRQNFYDKWMLWCWVGDQITFHVMTPWQFTLFKTSQSFLYFLVLKVAFSQIYLISEDTYVSYCKSTLPIINATYHWIRVFENLCISKKFAPFASKAEKIFFLKMPESLIFVKSRWQWLEFKLTWNRRHQKKKQLKSIFGIVCVYVCVSVCVRVGVGVSRVCVCDPWCVRHREYVWVCVCVCVGVWAGIVM